ncbi:MAG TPA: peptidoglycan-binding protein, partial [Nitrospiria bacterium]|nr:peptidoglycan-binding protein [Nitrospiria bacterium]
KLWGIDPPEAENIPVEDLTKRDGYQLLQAHSLRTYTVSPDLKRLRIFDYPCLLSGHWGEGTDTSFLVLTGLTDTEATVLDPLRGRKNLSLEMLQSLWGDPAVLVWKAVPGVVIPARGREGQGTVRTLQEALKTQGLYKGKVDGRMGPKTKQAVRLFQERWGLESDGIFGIESHLVLSRSLAISIGAPSLKAPTL